MSCGYFFIHKPTFYLPYLEFFNGPAICKMNLLVTIFFKKNTEQMPSYLVSRLTEISYNLWAHVYFFLILWKVTVCMLRTTMHKYMYIFVNLVCDCIYTSYSLFDWIKIFSKHFNDSMPSVLFFNTKGI